MDLTKLAFNKTQFVMATIALLFFAGTIAYTKMSRSEDPGYIIRAAQVTTTLPGASPERVELLVTDKLEKRIQEMHEIHYIKSESKTGISVITVNILESYTNMRPIWDKLRRKVIDGERDLPEDASTPIVNDEYGDVFGIVFSITGNGFNYAQIKKVADNARDLLLKNQRIAKVNIIAHQEERIFIDYNNARLAELNLSATLLEDTLRQRNIITSGGVLSTEIEQIAIEPTGDYKSVEDIRKTLISVPNSDQLVFLEDIATVYRGYIEPPVSQMRTSGLPSLGMAISMREGDNILLLGNEVLEFIEQLKETYPVGVEFEMVAYQPTRVSNIIDGFVESLIQAIVIVCVVMLVFLGLRTGLVVASLIPVTIVITFFIMSYFNIGLDQVSLAALMIALGMLVDNAIVISESILVMMRAGKTPIQAALDSAKELRVSLFISSLTTAAAFLPIYLAENATGEYTAAIFQVVTITLLTSWVVALTMIPVLCVTFLKGDIESDTKEVKDPLKTSPYYQMYRTCLQLILRHRILTLGATGGIFAFAMYGFFLLPNLFFPPADDPIFTAEIEVPIGSSIYYTGSVIDQMNRHIEKHFLVNKDRKEGIVNWATYIGTGGPRYRLQHDPEPPNPYYSYTLFNTTSRLMIPDLIAQLDDYFLDNFPDVKTKIRPLEMGSPVKNPIEVRISGTDVVALFELAGVVKSKLATIAGTREANDDWGLRAKKVVIDIDEPRAQRAGITHADVARSLESAISGVSLSQYREDDKLIPIVLRSVAAADIREIVNETFSVFSQATGKSVPIQQVADLQIEWEPAIVHRRDRFKTVTVFSNLDPGTTPTEVTNVLTPWLNTISPDWPLGYWWEYGGEFEKSALATDAIQAKIPVAFIIILLLLMAQFNTVKKTLIIIVTIPLAMIGVVLGLWINDSYFGFMTLLGVISLAGIVINNAIVLLDRIRLEIEDNGRTPQYAILVASQKRLRPILLTTITTACGLLPLWFGGSAMWIPMAITIIFGLLVSTLLTLGIVPVFYSLFFHISFKKFQYDPEVAS